MTQKGRKLDTGMPLSALPQSWPMQSAFDVGSKTLLTKPSNGCQLWIVCDLKNVTSVIR